MTRTWGPSGPFAKDEFDAAWSGSGGLGAPGSSSARTEDGRTHRISATPASPSPPSPDGCDCLGGGRNHPGPAGRARGGGAQSSWRPRRCARPRPPRSGNGRGCGSAPKTGRARAGWRSAPWLSTRSDAHTWRLLAGSRFLAGDIEGALAAWNHLSEPRADLTRIDGLTRIRYSAVAGQLDLPPGRLLTPRAFRQARRRLAELPAQMESRLSLRP